MPTTPGSPPTTGLAPTPSAPELVQSWRWPERYPTGAPLSTSAPSESSPAPADPPASSQPGQLPGETARSLAVRTSIVALASALLTGATSLGFRLDAQGSTALVGAITSILTLIALVRGRRG
jgi:hypothetical protein